MRDRGKKVREKRLPKYPVQISEDSNPILEITKSYYQKISLNKIVIDLDELPPSANALYDKSIHKNQRTKKHSIAMNISADVEAYRILVRNYFRRNSIDFKPKNIIAVVVELYSSKWLNKDLTPKQKDADNMIKPLFDAIEKASYIPDETIFEHFPFKMYSRNDRCLVTIYEIPSVIFSS